MTTKTTIFIHRPYHRIGSMRLSLPLSCYRMKTTWRWRLVLTDGPPPYKLYFKLTIPQATILTDARPRLFYP
ncbi:MAG: hypothetical protein IJT53_01900 [Prevotella sp.]|nr:hypothetical protein [Prevotella sp.]